MMGLGLDLVRGLGRSGLISGMLAARWRGEVVNLGSGGGGGGRLSTKGGGAGTPTAAAAATEPKLGWWAGIWAGCGATISTWA